MGGQGACLSSVRLSESVIQRMRSLRRNMVPSAPFTLLRRAQSRKRKNFLNFQKLKFRIRLSPVST